MLNWIYWAVSQVMLGWHWVWDKLGLGEWLGTNWDWVLSIVFLVLTVRAILFPLFVKQIRSQRAMQALQPKLKALQEKHKGDRETLQKEMMELYRTEKANPLMGCLPLVLQMPVFLGVFHVIRRLDGGAHDPNLYGWTESLFTSATQAQLFGVSIGATLRQGGAATVLCVIFGVIMIATTYMTSRQMILKTGWNEDPQQRMVQKIMLYGIPATMIISVSAFPLGLILYWTTTNLFSLGQQFWVLKKYPPMVNGKPVQPKPKSPEDVELIEAKRKELAPKVGAKPVNAKKGQPASPAKAQPAATPAKADQPAAPKKGQKPKVG
ncbi:membrane protein insertase YidC [Hamadaea tsunoensis]|uniref:membrane protein insertase YidC n=1 Tax=Hamadaea tsunoensis TaxID=53368 RepID=UPI0004833AA0|nr:membrane protein insertase YidC [Hamadaea tsunoensis]